MAEEGDLKFRGRGRVGDFLSENNAAALLPVNIILNFAPHFLIPCSDKDPAVENGADEPVPFEIRCRQSDDKST